MIDYAENVAGKVVNTKEDLNTAHISIKIIPLSASIVIAFLMYFVSYINYNIALDKHLINMKQAQLEKMSVDFENLKYSENKLLSSNNIILNSKGKNLIFAKARNIKIVH